MRNIIFSPPKSDILAFSVISIISSACFFKSYDGNFVFDDSEAIINNKDVKPDSPLYNLLQNDFWGSNISSERSHKSYRPLTVFTFRLNYMLAGGFDPLGFHLVSLSLYTVVCVFLYQVLRSLCRQTHIPAGVPWLASLLFSVHPIHAEAVCGIVGRAELLSAIFFLISLMCYIQLCNYKRGVLPFLMTWAVFIVSCVASVLSKEQGITVLGVCSAYDVLLHQSWEGGLLHQIREKIYSKGFVCRHTTLLVSGLVILSCRWWVMGGVAPVFKPVDNPQSFVNNTFMRLLNYHYVYSLNAWLCLCPLWLCFDWSMGCVPVISSFSDLRLLCPAIFWVILIVLVFKCFQNISTEFNRCMLFALSLAVIPFLPASNFLFPVGFVVAERVLFLPSIGVCLLFSAAICRLYHMVPKLRWFLTCGVCVVLMVYTLKCMKRSEEWRSEVILFESAQHVCPLNAKVHYNIAKVHADKGNSQKALDEYRLAIKLFPEYDQALNNLGNLLKDLKHLEEAETLLERAVNIRPDFAAAWMNLGIVQAELRKPASAEHSYLTALTHRRKYPDCLYNLGNLYLDASRHGDALQAWRNATLLNPSHFSAWVNMLILLDSLGRFEEMGIVAEEALRFNPEEASLHYNYANGLGKAGLYELSKKHYLKAIELQPETAMYYSNLGVLYHRWKRYDQAEVSYTRALQLDPGNSNTQTNLQMLERARHKHRKDKPG